MPITTYVAAQRRLLKDLRQYRHGRELTQRQVAEALDWSLSKVIRIEKGTVSITTVDLRALLSLYGITDPAVVRDLEEINRETKHDPLASYRDVYNKPSLRFFQYEAAARTVRDFTIVFVPGLLQTEDYAVAILKDVFDRDDASITKKVEYRLQRQEYMISAADRHFYFIIDESSLWRRVGSASVMSRQLDVIGELGQLDHVSVQILPFSAGATPGMKGPFIYLELGEEDDDENDVLYLENTNGDIVFRDNPETTSPYLAEFEDALSAAATTRDDHDELMNYLHKAKARLLGDDS
jgi:transcriptional regulator with XRE-family HTH domain